ncbi:MULTISPECIES: PIN domain-containing protein [unclassified Archaeoglobus]|jgi:predicted nucleic acid-binding protein|uniref:PIN domain-containing protein n=1 Tax=unclassified Archaeoglobus TaxID=2643606 RepID=UPI0025BF6D97|nr:MULTISPECIES: PIN domain-containing protein [unclassified Archaeoglobus]
MIVDASAVVEILFGSDIYQNIMEKVTSGEIRLRTSEAVKFEVCDSLIKKEDMGSEILQELLPLTLRFLDHITTKMNSDQLSKAVELSKALNLNFSSATCVILALSLGDVYVTADRSISNKLKKEGYPVLHLDELIF